MPPEARPHTLDPGVASAAATQRVEQPHTPQSATPDAAPPCAVSHGVLWLLTVWDRLLTLRLRVQRLWVLVRMLVSVLLVVLSGVLIAGSALLMLLRSLWLASDAAAPHRHGWTYHRSQLAHASGGGWVFSVRAHARKRISAAQTCSSTQINRLRIKTIRPRSGRPHTASNSQQRLEVFEPTLFSTG